jgi:uncharacterized protein (TIGR02246 family)
MGRANRLTPLLLVAALLLPPLAARADDGVEEQVRAAYAAWDEAFNRGDAAGVAAFYADDALFLPPTHEVTEGKAGVEKFFAGLFANGVTGHKLELIRAEGEPASPVGAAKWSAKGKGADGATAEVGGIATHVFERQADGSLKLKLHTFN